MSRPRLLVLDEPSLGLGPIIIKNLFGVLAEINSQGVTILLVEQNAVMALDFSHRAYVLETGRITISGASTDLACDESVRCAYLGGKE
jgi:branched-chain amino acid transport system ATP-binding protein